ncbi:MAG: PQQ-binding-like beta-propeller repeat protein [Planctomycetota bacterium]|nr:PQQ-binding-like beta-propeller repeat protein [Planctomycetota bacterium]
MKHLSCVLVLLFTLSPSFADDWPQWRGPKRTDISNEKGLLQSWGEEGPKKLWTTQEGGLGYSGFSIVGDSLYTMGVEIEGDDEFVLCLNTKDGSTKWKTTIGKRFKNGWGDGPRSTPTVDGESCYALTGSGTLACISTKDGSVQWQKEMKDLGGKVPFWGYCESILIDQNTLICTPGGSKGAIAALNKKSGDIIWQSKDFTDGAQYSSAIYAVIHNQPQYIQLTMKSLVGISPADGKVLWRSDWPGRTAVIPTPIVLKNRIYVSSGYGVGCKAIEISPKNEVKELWQNKVMVNHHGGVIHLNGKLYGYCDGRKGGWTCQDFATGEKVWNETEKLGKGAIAYADGCFYCLSEGKGEVVLIKESTEGWQESGRFTLDPQTEHRSPRGKVWVHPVISNGKLYLRDQEIIFCFNVAK